MIRPYEYYRGFTFQASTDSLLGRIRIPHRLAPAVIKEMTQDKNTRYSEDTDTDDDHVVSYLEILTERAYTLEDIYSIIHSVIDALIEAEDRERWGNETRTITLTNHEVNELLCLLSFAPLDRDGMFANARLLKDGRVEIWNGGEKTTETLSDYFHRVLAQSMEDAAEWC